MQLTGEIVAYDGECMTIRVPFRDTEQMIHKRIHSAQVILEDGRRISAEQRRKIFALVEDIGEYAGSIPRSKAAKAAQAEFMRHMQLLYLIDRADTEAVRRQLTYHYCSLCDLELFSLSSVDMSTARDFIDWLVEKCIEFDVPCLDTLLQRCEDVERYLYLCVRHRRCALCGAKADIHEVDTVGMGRNRNAIHHLGQRVQPLCRKHHAEAHSIGQKRFNERYHLDSVKLDAALCKTLGWRK